MPKLSKPKKPAKVKTALYVDREIFEEIQGIADDRDTPISRVIRKALSEYVQRNPVKK